jgi:hypothetical protein
MFDMLQLVVELGQTVVYRTSQALFNLRICVIGGVEGLLVFDKLELVVSATTN